MKSMAGLLLVGVLAVSLPGPARAQTVGDVFRKVYESVVVIRAKGQEVSPRTGAISTFTETGSGVLISADGKVMTAAHVVHAMSDITVEFPTGGAVKARVIASEPGADLSLMQLEQVPPGAKVARMANSDSMRIGDQVIVVGAPYGLSHSLTVGHISARYAPNTVYRAFPLAEFFQTDAPINTGNSGGPMFNMAGEVIGIVSHIISKSGGSEGLGFVVTINNARQLLLERRAIWTGLEFYLLTERQAAVLNLPQPGGMLIKAVAKDSPADQAGLAAGVVPAVIDGQEMVLGGDIILAVAGIPITDAGSAAKVRQHLASLPPNAPFKIRVLRLGKIIELTAKLP
ncbi:MAG TPA: trypsin-like peptidase domain-containing protein [Methylomirabilota bacterium]|nr:trypsin-like peptidase domain-containing protein [Methylomirabilota bacterium]